MINNIQKHRGHPKQVVVLKTDPNQPKQYQHYGKLVCRLCDGAFVRWASQDEIRKIGISSEELGV